MMPVLYASPASFRHAGFQEAAGLAKKTDRDFARFLGYSLGSATELEYHIIVARDVHAITQANASLLSQVVEVKKMLHGLIARLSDE